MCIQQKINWKRKWERNKSSTKQLKWANCTSWRVIFFMVFLSFFSSSICIVLQLWICLPNVWCITVCESHFRLALEHTHDVQNNIMHFETYRKRHKKVKPRGKKHNSCERARARVCVCGCGMVFGNRIVLIMRQIYFWQTHFLKWVLTEILQNLDSLRQYRIFDDNSTISNI